jgi:hypothetical protein
MVVGIPSGDACAEQNLFWGFPNHQEIPRWAHAALFPGISTIREHQPSALWHPQIISGQNQTLHLLTVPAGNMTLVLANAEKYSDTTD